ncbi:hypothetical protein Acr_11g0016850 [Actinidia rufa]|uniref:Uncharacterized protein n=1 Tax=Actinidia rufa TaxID=165716 RepID=A0A7J0FGS7_9ERIC|nr:hypothetical protein Acr_11g0016850 [Actinidia rufa]
MAEKGVSMTPMAPADVYPRSDQEFAASQYSDELRQKKRRKLFIYIAAFTVFQIIVIMVQFGVLLLDVEAKLRGEVHLMKMMGMEIILVKKRKGAELDCTMEVNLNNGQIQNMDCDD